MSLCAWMSCWRRAKKVIRLPRLTMLQPPSPTLPTRWEGAGAILSRYDDRTRSSIVLSTSTAMAAKARMNGAGAA